MARLDGAEMTPAGIAAAICFPVAALLFFLDTRKKARAAERAARHHPSKADAPDALEAEVNRVWGSGQFDWSIGRSPEGWFYYCGTMQDRARSRGVEWKHSGHEPTLTAALRKMIALEHEPSNRVGVDGDG